MTVALDVMLDTEMGLRELMSSSAAGYTATDDLDRGCYVRDSDNEYPNRFDRNHEDAGYDIRRKDGRFRGKNDYKAKDFPHRDWGYFATGRCSRREASCGICKPKVTTMNLYSTFDKRNFIMECSSDGHLLYNHTGSCYVPSVDETIV